MAKMGVTFNGLDSFLNELRVLTQKLGAESSFSWSPKSPPKPKFSASSAMACCPRSRAILANGVLQDCCRAKARGRKNHSAR